MLRRTRMAILTGLGRRRARRRPDFRGGRRGRRWRTQTASFLPWFWTWSQKTDVCLELGPTQLTLQAKQGSDGRDAHGVADGALASTPRRRTTSWRACDRGRLRPAGQRRDRNWRSTRSGTARRRCSSPAEGPCRRHGCCWAGGCKSGARTGRPLYVACENGHVDLARLLLNKGADIDRAEKEGGWAPLLFACQNGHVEAARLLLDRGARFDGKQLMDVACKGGHVNVAKLLMERGVIDHVDQDGSTALHRACHTGEVTTAETLLKLGPADAINQKDKQGRTPLFVACERVQTTPRGCCYEKALQSTRRQLGLDPAAHRLQVRQG